MSNLEHVLNNIKSDYKLAAKYQFKAQFYPYKHLSHTIRKRNTTIFIRLSDKLYNAPDDILKSITIILLDKLFRVKTSPSLRKSYKHYVNEHVLPHIPAIKRKISSDYRPDGKFFNLDTIFEKINSQYFNSLIKKPAIGWSLKKSFRRLGFYDHERDLLVISRLFDHNRVPQYVVEYIMYHEMLHVLYPVERVNGRRVVHSKQFKKQELIFKEYTLATRWIHKKLWHLKISF